MKMFFAAILMAFAVFSLLPGQATDDGFMQLAQAEKSEQKGEWVLVKPPLKPGKYTLRVEKYVEEGVGCENDLCGCWQTGSGCGSGETCVGVGICVPESSGIRGGRDVPTYMMP